MFQPQVFQTPGAKSDLICLKARRLLTHKVARFHTRRSDRQQLYSNYKDYMKGVCSDPIYFDGCYMRPRVDAHFLPMSIHDIQYLPTVRLAGPLFRCIQVRIPTFCVTILWPTERSKCSPANTSEPISVTASFHCSDSQEPDRYFQPVSHCDSSNSVRGTSYQLSVPVARPRQEVLEERRMWWRRKMLTSVPA